jgi:hypothetical protein
LSDNNKRDDAIDAVLKKAALYIGTEELSGNRGIQVDTFNSYANAPTGSPWCASFVAWCGRNVEGYSVPNSPACDVLLAWARRRKCLHKTPKRGDIFLIMNPSDSDDATHTGFVTGVTDDGGVLTIEGNSNLSGSREGTSVVKRDKTMPRRNKNILFVRWADLIDPVDDDSGEFRDPDTGVLVAKGASSALRWMVRVGEDPKTCDILPTDINSGVAFVDYTRLIEACNKHFPLASTPGWDRDSGGILLNNAPVPSSVPRRLIRNEAWVGVRAAADWLGLRVDVSGDKKTIQVKA